MKTARRADFLSVYLLILSVAVVAGWRLVAWAVDWFSQTPLGVTAEIDF
ncbi:MAG: hypothetical protein JNL17_07360 [Cyclobacteriaceae bacterium]|nr:hypothetical protein [Cyclobacteriaceae bacterium]